MGPQKAIHTFDAASEKGFSIVGNGFFDGTTTSNALGITTALRGNQYMLGSSPVLSLGASYDNANAWAALFDEYRIVQLQVDIYFSANSNSTGTVQFTGLTGPFVLPLIYICTDYNDINPLATASQALAYSSCQNLQLGNSSGNTGGRQSYIVKRPAVQTQELDVTSSSFAATRHSPWLSTDDENATHNGIKIYLDTLNDTGTVQIGIMQVVVRARLQFRNVK
jgi:hypothetical protein